MDGKEKGYFMTPQSLFEVLEANMKNNKGTPIVFSPKGVEEILKTLP
ncbi:MAG: hypothetical protein HYU69_11270 [Bacteroidetes bacterium]|nr:hypothetical protein [Bacteroidota bacterium]